MQNIYYGDTQFVDMVLFVLSIIWCFTKYDSKNIHYITANDSNIYVIDITNMNTGKPMIVLLICRYDINTGYSL